MFSRKNWMVVVVAVLLVASLAGCAAQEVQLPDRVVEVKVETALAAQQALVEGLLTGGEVNMTEEEFSSLVTVLATQNGGEFNIIEEIKVWFDEGGQFTAQISLLDGTLPESFLTDDIIIAGKIEDKVQDIGAHFNGRRVGRFGLASLVAQESDAEETAEEAADEAEKAAEEAADEAEKAAEEKADEAEKAAEEKADAAEQQLRQGISVEEASVGGVPVPENMLPMISEQMNFALSFLQDFYSTIMPAAGEVNINF